MTGMTTIRLAAELATLGVGELNRPRLTGVLTLFGVLAHPDGPYPNVIIGAGAIDMPGNLSRVKLVRDHDETRAIGVLVELATDDGQMTGTFELGRSADAAEALALAQDGVLDGFSVGLDVLDGYTHEGVFHVTHGRLREVSLLAVPAFDDARLTEIAAKRKDNAMPDENPAPAPAAPVAAPVAAPLTAEQVTNAVRAALAPANLPAVPAVPADPAVIVPTQVINAGSAHATPRGGGHLLVDRDGYGRTAPAYIAANGMRITAGDYFGGYLRARQSGNFAEFERIRAALTHETTDLVPGLLPQQILGPLIGTFEPARRVWNSLNVRVMPSLSGTFQRPKITQHTAIGEQTAEKTEVSSQPMKVELDDVAKMTIAGALNLSMQAIDWTSPAILDLVISDFGRVYAVRTETYAVQWLVAAATATPISVINNDPALINAAFYQAAANVFNSGGNYIDTVPDTVWMSPDVWALLGGLADADKRPIWPYLGASNAMGTMDPGSQTGGIGSLRYVVSNQFAANTLIVGDSRQLEVYEDRRGLLQATEPSVLGLQIATYGYIANYAITPAAFQKITLTAPVIEAAARTTASK